ncbi:MAG: hypothetical protein V4636_13475 [Pseudomonadota bacterium]
MEKLANPQADATAAAAPAAMSDDTMVPADIAAVYLGMSPSELAESHQPKRTDGRASSRSASGGRIDKSAKANAPPATYALGVLRQLRKTQTAPVGLDAAIKAGLSGWMTAKLPFFAELEPRVKRGRRVLIANAWEGAGAGHETHFADLIGGRTRLTWLTSVEASASLWRNEAEHRAFAARGLALLAAEAEAIEASIAATARMEAGASMSSAS